ncbi:F-box/LRR-repeat protein 2 isoform X2 [Cajanus cajan]|uniref:F-box/LRR-repeat protein 2 isoform X2 n=1 Tax=Cajanus cajan TaxID=3821 RepID=UPI00098DCBA4|nr:F-box/LRR-repeat protein 2 isoform X2 [Cajanus cajan]
MSVKDFPEECWELVFRFLGHGPHLESLSMVCKQFLSITNRFLFSLAIHDPTIPLLPRLFLRFPRLKTLDFTHFNGHHEGLLHQISQSGLDLDLINLSNQRTLPVDGLRELGSKMQNLRVLICSNIGSLRDSHLVVMAYSFPFLEELDISFPLDSQASDFGVQRLSSLLENLRKINISEGGGLMLKKLILQDCCNCTFSGISYVLTKCQSVQCLDLRKIDFLTDQCISELSMFLLSLTSINLSGCCQLTNSTFFILTRNCPLLSEIKMERTYLGMEGEEDSMKDFVVNLEVKKVYLGDNVLLSDASLIKFASICPSLQLLDLTGCEGVSSECIVKVLKRCCEIRHLNLAYTGMEVFEIDFEVSQLEVLNLSGSRIEDEALSIISRRCSGLLLLNIQSCWHVTPKGVKQVVENCRALKELNLKNCWLVSGDFIAWVEFSRPSLRTIVTPSDVGAY